MTYPAASLDYNLRQHIYRLAHDIGERNIYHPQALHAAESYIHETFEAQGYRVQRQEYTVEGVHSANLEVTRLGSRQPEEIILIGAHYDSVIGSPGANDNASGVAALLEISRLFTQVTPDKTVRLVAFVNEEPPLFISGQQGSMVYSKMARQRGDNIRLMISLETMGYYRDQPNSQRYPPLLHWFYPNTANFIAFISNLRSRAMLKRMTSAFRSVSDFPAQSAALPAFIPGVAWSDQLSFWRRGYRALMVTDTAFYRYPWYHSPQDTPDRLDYPRLARVTTGLFHGVVRLLEELS